MRNDANEKGMGGGCPELIIQVGVSPAVCSVFSWKTTSSTVCPCAILLCPSSSLCIPRLLSTSAILKT